MDFTAHGQVGGWPHILAYEEGARGDASVESMSRALAQPSAKVARASVCDACVVRSSSGIRGSIRTYVVACYHVLGLIGAVFAENISVFQSSSLKVVPIR
jgi:hypothetical protein